MQIATYLNGQDVEKSKAAIEFLKTSGQPFTVTLTNYTINIKGAVNYKFMKNERSFKFFSYYNKLKKEVCDFLAKTPLPPCDKVFYYDIKPKEDFSLKNVYNIDLTAAYLHILKNENIISENLFNELNNLDKQDRLSIVGMLAGRKSQYNFDDKGKIINCEIIEDKALRNVFFHCVQCTFLIMQQIKQLIDESYIFSWVDGVYFSNESDTFLINEYLRELNYPCTVEKLSDFKYINKKDFVLITFDKGVKTKSFNIPTKKNKFAKDFYEYLQAQY